MLYNTLSKYPTQHTYSKWLLQKVPFRLHGSSSLCKWEAVSTWTGTVAPFVVQHSQTILAIAVATLGREFGENLTILEPTMPHSNQKSASLAFPWWSCRIYHMRCGQNFWFSQRTLVQVVNPPRRSQRFDCWHEVNFEGTSCVIGGCLSPHCSGNQLASECLNVGRIMIVHNLINLYYLHIVICNGVESSLGNKRWCWNYCNTAIVAKQQDLWIYLTTSKTIAKSAIREVISSTQVLKTKRNLVSMHLVEEGWS